MRCMIGILCICSIHITHGSCGWNVDNYGYIDLSPLQNLQIQVLREQKAQYSLLLTPCGNHLFCDRDVYDDKYGMALQVMTDSLPDTIDCNGIISAWDNGHTKPRHEINENDEHVLVFSYPVFPAQTHGDSCEGGRSGEFTFVCEETAVPYEPAEFHQDAKDENGVCAYFGTIRTTYACPTEAPVVASDSGLGYGSIFLVVFMCCVVCYCIGGYVINGYKRKEWKDVKTNVPHWHFWSHVPQLVKTGCVVSKEFVFGVIGSNKQHEGATDNLYDEEDREL